MFLHYLLYKLDHLHVFLVNITNIKNIDVTIFLKHSASDLKEVVLMRIKRVFPG